MRVWSREGRSSEDRSSTTREAVYNLYNKVSRGSEWLYMTHTFIRPSTNTMAVKHRRKGAGSFSIGFVVLVMASFFLVLIMSRSSFSASTRAEGRLKATRAQATKAESAHVATQAIVAVSESSARPLCQAYTHTDGSVAH